MPWLVLSARTHFARDVWHEKKLKGMKWVWNVELVLNLVPKAISKKELAYFFLCIITLPFYTQTTNWKDLQNDIASLIIITKNGLESEISVKNLQF